MIRAAIFDYGDTLVCHSVPYEAILRRAIRANYRFFTKAGYESTFEEFRGVNETVFAEFAEVEAKENRDIPDTVKYNGFVAGLFPAKPRVWRERLAERANRGFHDFGARYRRAGTGAMSSLKKLKSMGLKMVVLSNHSDQGALERSLKQFKLDSYFLRVYSSSQLGVRKPDPRAFAKCLGSLRARANQTVFVGDSPRNDIAGARACGMMTILVNRGARREHPEVLPPDFTVTRLTEIPRIIGRLNAL